MIPRFAIMICLVLLLPISTAVAQSTSDAISAWENTNKVVLTTPVRQEVLFDYRAAEQAFLSQEPQIGTAKVEASRSVVLGEYLQHAADGTDSPVMSALMRKVLLGSTGLAFPDRKQRGRLRVKTSPKPADVRIDGDLMRPADVYLVVVGVHEVVVEKPQHLTCRNTVDVPAQEERTVDCVLKSN